MDIASNGTILQSGLYTKRLDSSEIKALRESASNSMNKYTFKEFSQNNFFQKEELSVGEKILKTSEEFSRFLYENGIDGVHVKRISELTFIAPSFLDTKV